MQNEGCGRGGRRQTALLQCELFVPDAALALTRMHTPKQI